MLWILFVQCLIGAILAIAVGGNSYKKTYDLNDLGVCCIGFGLLAFSLMFGATSIFAK